MPTEAPTVAQLQTELEACRARLKTVEEEKGRLLKELLRRPPEEVLRAHEQRIRELQAERGTRIASHNQERVSLIGNVRSLQERILKAREALRHQRLNELESILSSAEPGSLDPEQMKVLTEAFMCTTALELLGLPKPSEPNFNTRVLDLKERIEAVPVRTPPRTACEEALEQVYQDLTDAGSVPPTTFAKVCDVLRATGYLTTETPAADATCSACGEPMSEHTGAKRWCPPTRGTHFTPFPPRR